PPVPETAGCARRSTRAAARAHRGPPADAETRSRRTSMPNACARSCRAWPNAGCGRRAPPGARPGRAPRRGTARRVRSREPIAVLVAKHEIVFEHQQIDAGPPEAVNRVLRRADDRLVIVERGVDHEWHAGQFLEFVDRI